MKQLLLLLLCGLYIVLLISCQGVSRSKNGVEVIIEGDGEFPQSIVGQWKADKHGWEFIFEPDGTISSAVISLGRVRVKPGQAIEVPMRLGGKGVYEPGEWLVHYAPADRELTVEISLKNFYAELGDDVLEGKSTDIFVGKVSENGKVWQVEWRSFPDYIAHTDKYPHFEMTEGLEDGISNVLTFEKVIEK